jgi:DNA mismatch endonuclease, patch repair protein
VSSLPYPFPTSPAASSVMRSNRRVNTSPELRIRSALHRRGLRFRKDYLLVVGSTRVRVDIVFPRRRVAVFVDGCFWHRCPSHGAWPKSNLSYWLPKLRGNAERDRRVNAALAEGGWRVVRIWEHVTTSSAEDVVIRALQP